MSSNLRAAPIEGFICDSAGNIIRNTIITIKDNNPNGSNIIDSIKSDDNGYFVSNPQKNGTYDIYESGVKTSRTLHIPSMHNFQSWLALADNIPDNLPTFSQMDETSDNNINKFRFYIQLENDNIDIKQYDHIFPIYNFDITPVTSDWNAFSTFHGITSDSRITTTRFDVEYYNPLVSSSDSYRRIRWCGIPAISYFIGSKLVLPLDYYSIRINRLNNKTVFLGNVDYIVDEANDTLKIFDLPETDGGFSLLYDTIVKGDIVKLSFATGVTPSEFIFYGIFVKNVLVNDTVPGLLFKRWKSSNYISTPMSTLQTFQESMNISDLSRYDGFFNGISNIGVSTNEKFTVVENIYAQDVDDELYNYSIT